MRYFYITLSAFICAAMLLSCTGKGDSEISELSDEPEWAVLVKQEIEPVYEESVSEGDFGKYKYFLEASDNLIGISSSKPGPLDEPNIKCYSGPESSSTGTKGSFENTCRVLLNGKDFGQTKSVANEFPSIFGRKITFSISPLTKSSDNADCTVELYAPKEIEIISPVFETENDLLPLCYHDGFEIQWNGDEYNKNGVVFILEWNGSLVLGDDIPDTYIRRTCVVEDTGETVLSKTMFNGIPDTAVCHLTIVRGDIDITDIDKMSYKTMVETHEFMTFILIREIIEN